MTMATVRADCKLPNEQPAKGSIRVEVNTSGQRVRDPIGNVVFAGPMTVKLINGVATFPVPATDDATLSPTDFTYTFTEQLDHVSRGDERVVTSQAPGGTTVELADLASTDEAAHDPHYEGTVGLDAFNALALEVAGLGTGKQPVNDNLTAIAALITTTYGRALLELAGQTGLMALLSAATTGAQGVVELATTLEATTGTDDQRAVTPAGVKAVIDQLVNGAPGALDTLKELADRFSTDESAATALTALVGGIRTLTDATFLAALTASLGPNGTAGNIDKPTAQGIALVQSLIFGA